jgi:type I restriction enzyme S subunit
MLAVLMTSPRRTAPAHYSLAAVQESMPLGWTAIQVDAALSLVKQGPRFDKKSVSECGAVPVLDQTVDGILGFHNGPPGVVATTEDPVVTFANHTCNLRMMDIGFSSIQNVFVFRGKVGVSDTLFLYYWLQGRISSTEYKGFFPTLRSMWLPLPPLDEQRRISGVLGALDDLIEVNRGLAQDCEHLAQVLVSRVSGQVTLSTFTTWGGLSTIKPDGTVDHYSLPAFDDGRTAERVDGGTIKSNKQRIDKPCVLVARLNPHIPRVWMVYPDEFVTSVASTEFVSVKGDAVPQEVVYAVCSSPEFLRQMSGLVTGTTGSHQRVDKDALTGVPVPDVRTLEPNVIEAITQLIRQAHALRVEIRDLAATRDELLPLLMSGRVRVSEAVAA